MLIGCAQAVEHYEMARYGVLKTGAKKLGLDEAEGLLAETLDEAAVSQAGGWPNGRPDAAEKT